MKILIYVFIIILLSMNCNFVDFQLDAIECYPWEGRYLCKEETFYRCASSSRWVKLIHCTEVNDEKRRELYLSIYEYSNCCMGGIDEPETENY